MNGGLEVIEDDILTLTLIDTGSHADILRKKRLPERAVQLRDFNPGKNIGIVWRNPAMPIFRYSWTAAA